MSEQVDILAVSPHPDDVEIGCGATLAKCAMQLERRVGIVLLTRGERGTRGTIEERRAEGQEAARRLGAVAVEWLDCGDGALRTGEAEEDTLISLLRRWRPQIVFAPPAHDRHPDHERASKLVRHACFYSGLTKRGAGEPHRPASLFHYMLHDAFEPSFVVDVTSSWSAKMQALDAYESQLFRPGLESERREPQTKVSSREFRLALEGRARHYGQMIGVEFGEPFASGTPLAIADPWSLRARGLR